MIELVVELAGRTLRHALPPGECVLGSGEDCDVRIPHPTVSRRHALLIVDESGIGVRDVGSRNGTLYDGQRIIGTQPVAAGGVLLLGSVTVRLEAVGERDLETAVAFDNPRGPADAGDPPRATTVSLGSLKAFALERLPRLLMAARKAHEQELVDEVGSAISDCLPCVSVRIERQYMGEHGVTFEHRAAGHAPVDTRLEHGGIRLRVGFLSAEAAATYRPLLEALTRLIGDHGSDQPAAGRSSDTPPDLPRPETRDAAMRRIYQQAAQVARGDISVLISGESGTGKEVLARYIQAASRRAGRPFVSLNCAALPADLLESELFGVESGVATGVSARPGKFEQAHGGTLFLDEIGDMAVATQARILRVLQERELYRVGGRDLIKADVRIIAATNQDLLRMVEEGAFRRDLFHRIADWQVRLPPLRERSADVANLAAWFLSRQPTGPFAGISSGALDRLLSHSWPGNVRELEREIARAALFMAPGEVLRSQHLSPAVGNTGPVNAGSLADRLQRLERSEIRSAMERHDQNISAAARELGMARSTLYRKLEELELNP